MSRIFITGDLHGEIDIRRLNTAGFPEQKDLTKDDYLIIAGDFGLLWQGSKEEKFWLKWLETRNYTTLFIDGNHENFEMLNSYPVTQWNGGNIHQISPSIYHLMRGQMFTINEKKFFTFGGASSIDKERRKEGISWWPEEIPSHAEFEEGMQTLDNHHWLTDYVITHTCPTESLMWMKGKYGFDLKPIDPVNQYLDLIKPRLGYSHWFFGHFHENLNLPDNLHMLYYDIVELK